MKFRDLRADEIELRVSNCKENGSQWLLYKNARTDMDILDETVGIENWQRDHKEIKGTVYAGVAVRTEGGWVWKWDAGSESSFDKEKGEASDSFKRACFNLGIGRALYSAPALIWIASDKVPVRDTGRKDKYGKSIFESKTYKGEMTVTEIAYHNGKISVLKIAYKGKEVYSMTTKTKTEGDDLYVTEAQFGQLMQLDSSKALSDGINGYKEQGAQFRSAHTSALNARYKILKQGEKE